MAESFYIDRLVNAGVEIPIAGRIVRVYQLTMGDHGRLQAIIRRLQPHPMTEAKEMAAGIELKEIAAEILRDGYQGKNRWPAPLDSEEGIRVLMNDADGRRAIVACGLRISDEEADRLIDSISIPEFVRIMSTAIIGIDPATVEHDEVPADPKDVPLAEEVATADATTSPSSGTS